jgi:hypothetical protein
LFTEKGGKMKIKKECLGCRYFQRERIGGSAPEGEHYEAECLLGFNVQDGSEDCKVDEE